MIIQFSGSSAAVRLTVTSNDAHTKPESAIAQAKRIALLLGPSYWACGVYTDEGKLVYTFNFEPTVIYKNEHMH